MKGRLYIISGPSGVGKSTLIKRLVNSVDKMEVVVAFTTRAMRPNEKEGIDYHFISKERFKSLMLQDELLEYFEFQDQYYGAIKKPVKDKLAEGIDLIIDLDYKPARFVRETIPESKSIFILPSSQTMLKTRLEKRGEQKIEGRLEKAKEVIPHYLEYDHIIFNDNLDEASIQLQSIVQAERTRILCQEMKYDKTLTEIGVGTNRFGSVLSMLKEIPVTQSFCKNSSQIKVMMLPSWSNTSYKISYGNESYFLRVPRRGNNVLSDRKVEYQNLLKVSQQGLYVDVSFYDRDNGIFLTPYIENEGVLSSQDLKEEKAIQAAAFALNQLHYSNIALTATCNPIRRIELIYAQVKDTKLVESESLDGIFKRIRDVHELICLVDPKLVPSHNDATIFNFLKSKKGIVLTDWESAAMNNIFWDGANLSIEASFEEKQDDQLLKFYKHHCAEQEGKSLLILHKPIVEFWLSIWLLYQIKIQNDAASVATFENKFRERFKHCVALLESPEFARAQGIVFEVLKERNALPAKKSDYSQLLLELAGSTLFLCGLFSRKRKGQQINDAHPHYSRDESRLSTGAVVQKSFPRSKL